MDKYGETRQVINKMAEVKMMMNNHKGNIEDVPSHKIRELLQGEVNELHEAVCDGDLMHIIEEAADVQNFLTALVYQQIQTYRGRK